jgi:hypothetical protein
MTQSGQARLHFSHDHDHIHSSARRDGFKLCFS